MYEFLKITHSIVRYVILIGGIGAVAAIFSNARSRAKLFSTIFLASTHLQVIIGLILYFNNGWFGLLKEQGMKGIMENSKEYPYLRFFVVEHIIMMLIAAVLVTIGHSKLKKAIANDTKLKPALILFIIALVVMLAAIPWPFREALGRGWI